jgi:hypothetical protein
VAIGTPEEIDRRDAELLGALTIATPSSPVLKDRFDRLSPRYFDP